MKFPVLIIILLSLVVNETFVEGETITYVENGMLYMEGILTPQERAQDKRETLERLEREKSRSEREGRDKYYAQLISSSMENELKMKKLEEKKSRNYLKATSNLKQRNRDKKCRKHIRTKY